MLVQIGKIALVKPSHRLAVVHCNVTYRFAIIRVRIKALRQLLETVNDLGIFGDGRNLLRRRIKVASHLRVLDTSHRLQRIFRRIREASDRVRRNLTRRRLRIEETRHADSGHGDNTERNKRRKQLCSDFHFGGRQVDEDEKGGRLSEFVANGSQRGD